ncbi:MAG TPA: HNH endonuclease [Vicinamibacteria bacterium]|nr:HNH endonuclease [Vicinamibacteria bacterium]
MTRPTMPDREDPAPDPLRSLSDDELLGRLSALLRQSRRAESELVAHIGEVNDRRLYAREACDSMFTYCTNVLHLSEHEAYLRIAVARAARARPVLLAMLADGRLHLSGIAKLAPHLTDENRDHVLARAVHQTKRRIEALVAELVPRPDVPSLIRRLPERRDLVPGSASRIVAMSAAAVESVTQVDSVARMPGGTGVAMALQPVGPASLPLGPDQAAPSPADRTRSGPASAAPRALVEALAPGRYKVQFTASAAFCEKLDRLKALMRSSVPDGDLAGLLEAAVTEKLQRLEARRYARVKTPRERRDESGGTMQPATARWTPALRGIPAAMRRTVYERDGGRCRYRDGRGRRCPARESLQFHHVVPRALGGPHSVDNVRLMCRVHNVFLAEVDYGKRLMARYRRRPGPVSDA